MDLLSMALLPVVLLIGLVLGYAVGSLRERNHWRSYYYLGRRKE